jgi:hypothetical protein
MSKEKDNNMVKIKRQHYGQKKKTTLWSRENKTTLWSKEKDITTVKRKRQHFSFDDIVVFFF